MSEKKEIKKDENKVSDKAKNLDLEVAEEISKFKEFYDSRL